MHLIVRRTVSVDLGDDLRQHLVGDAVAQHLQDGAHHGGGDGARLGLVEGIEGLLQQGHLVLGKIVLRTTEESKEESKVSVAKKIILNVSARVSAAEASTLRARVDRTRRSLPGTPDVDFRKLLISPNIKISKIKKVN